MKPRATALRRPQAPRRGRQSLPQRRDHWSIVFEHGSHRYTGGWGAFADGQLAEIFLNTEKNGTALDVAARDAAISASLLLQFGCPVATLRRALTRNGDGSASGPLGVFLDRLEQIAGAESEATA
jgi:ribonucleoside-diphosphate reductase alpha chain